MNSVVHFEIPFDDVERARKFYSNTFGWLMTSMPEYEYTTVHTGETDAQNMPKNSGFINGGMMKRNDKIAHPVITIGVSDMDDSIKKVMNNGGKLVMEKQVIPKIGYSAYVQDSEGNTIGLFQPIKM